MGDKKIYKKINRKRNIKKEEETTCNYEKDRERTKNYLGNRKIKKRKRKESILIKMRSANKKRRTKREKERNGERGVDRIFVNRQKEVKRRKKEKRGSTVSKEKESKAK